MNDVDGADLTDRIRLLPRNEPRSFIKSYKRAIGGNACELVIALIYNAEKWESSPGRWVCL